MRWGAVTASPGAPQGRKGRGGPSRGLRWCLRPGGGVSSPPEHPAPASQLLELAQTFQLSSLVVGLSVGSCGGAL